MLTFKHEKGSAYHILVISWLDSVHCHPTLQPFSLPTELQETPDRPGDRGRWIFSAAGSTCRSCGGLRGLLLQGTSESTCLRSLAPEFGLLRYIHDSNSTGQSRRQYRFDQLLSFPEVAVCHFQMERRADHRPELRVPDFHPGFRLIPLSRGKQGAWLKQARYNSNTGVAAGNLDMQLGVST